MGILDRLKAVVVPPTPVAAAAVRVVDQTRQMDRPFTESREASEAWTVWRCVGEVHYSTTQQARLVGRLDWTLSIGGGEPMDTESSDAVIAAAYGGMKRFRNLTKTAALHFQVAGAYWLCRTTPGDNKSWKVIAHGPSAAQKKLIESSDIIIEVREEDPKDPSRNDSPVLASLDTSRELILIRAQARAQSRNRTAQHGLLIVPKEAQVNQQALMDVMTAPLANEQSAASVVPNILEVPAEYVEKFKDPLNIGGDYDEKLSEKETQKVRALAVQLDVPPELLLGFGDANHWSAWAIQEDNWLGHVEPMASPIGDGFAMGIQRQLALGTGADGDEIELNPDPGPLLVRRPTPGDAMAAYELDLVSADWTREQIGADETDAPDAAELAAKRPPVMDAPNQIESPAVSEPLAIAAAARPAIDGKSLAAIDTQAYDAFEDLIRDTADRTLELLGAKIRRVAAGQKIDMPRDVPNMTLAIKFEGEIPNSLPLIESTIADSLPKVERIIDRAFARLRAQGVELSVDPDDLASVWSLYQSLTADIVALRLAGKTADAETWQASRRIVAQAGGNGDTGPVVAAAGVKVTGVGIALGQRALAQITQVYNLVPGKWTWLHEYRGPNPHPEHQRFNGRSFNGDFILAEGINWYPGDHAGCMCGSVPEFVEAS